MNWEEENPFLDIYIKSLNEPTPKEKAINRLLGIKDDGRPYEEDTGGEEGEIAKINKEVIRALKIFESAYILGQSEKKDGNEQGGGDAGGVSSCGCPRDVGVELVCEIMKRYGKDNANTGTDLRMKKFLEDLKESIKSRNPNDQDLGQTLDTAPIASYADLQKRYL